MTPILDRATIRGFKVQILTPRDPAYDDARRVFNAAVDRRPAMIAGCGARATWPPRCGTRARVGWR